ncbi:MAG: FKBP-type peptidyl-prolyl cis-trans isomerase [Pontibacterium sp.]
MLTYLVPIFLLVLVVFFIKRSRDNKQQAAQNITAGDQFLMENKDKDGVITTASGLQYQVLKAGTGTVHPRASDRVKVHYHGTLLDGRIFDSSIDRGEPIEFGLNQVIAGWTEGLQLMVTGEKTRLFIPGQLAYGNSSAGIITPGSTLIFDVELLAINA